MDFPALRILAGAGAVNMSSLQTMSLMVTWIGGNNFGIFPRNLVMLRNLVISNTRVSSVVCFFCLDHTSN